MIKCPSCGSEIQYDPSKSKVTCQYCGNEFDPKQVTSNNFASEYNDISANNPKEDIKAYRYTCASCGGEILAFEDTAVTFCNYCGSSNALKHKLIQITKPDYIVPFKITKEEAVNLVLNKIQNTKYLPDYIKNAKIPDLIRGIYMPYALYKFNYQNKVIAYGEKFAYMSGDYQYYQKYVLDLDLDSHVDGLVYDLVSKFYDEYSKAIGGYDLRAKEPFNLSYVAGFYADSKDIDNHNFIKEASKKANDYKLRATLDNPLLKKFGVKNVDFIYDVDADSVVMLPVYFIALRDEATKEITYAVVNGQTGKIAMDLPVDKKAFTKKFLILGSIIGVLLSFLIYINFKQMLIITMIMQLISFFTLSSQIKTINKRSKNDPHSKPVSMKSKYILSLILSIFFGLIILASNSIHDELYIITILIITVLNILIMHDVIGYHNIMTKRKLPQFEERGGDKK